MCFPRLSLPVGVLLGPAAVFLILTVACTTLRPVRPDQLSGPHAPDNVLVTGLDHSKVVLYAPRVVGDTLEGTIKGRGVIDNRRRFLLSQTTTIQKVQAAPARTAALVALVALSAGMTYLLIQGSEKICTCQLPDGTTPLSSCCS
jgi:hypothetical protein